jgi:hypothetical protein
MSRFRDLPDRRQSVRGTTDQGDEIWFIRSISQKLYRCGCCRHSIEPGDDHVVVQYIFRSGDREHSHWHRRCVEEVLYPSTRALKVVSASQPSRGRGESGGRRSRGRRR